MHLYLPSTVNIKSQATEYSGSLTQNAIEIASPPVPSPGHPRPCSRHCWKETVLQGGRKKEPGLVGNAPLPKDAKATAALPNSPILIFKRDPANA